MKNKTETTTQQKTAQLDAQDSEIAMHQTGHDFVAALLITSLAINVLVLITWLLTQTTTAYNRELALLLGL